MYNLKTATAVVEWSAAQGVQQCHDGLGMLVEQAAEAFAVWRGVRPHTRQLMSSLRAP